MTSERDNEQAWREYAALIRNGDFSSGSSDWERREHKQRELVQDTQSTALLSGPRIDELRQLQKQRNTY